jgi:hypothetical protein
MRSGLLTDKTTLDDSKQLYGFHVRNGQSLVIVERRCSSHGVTGAH